MQVPPEQTARFYRIWLALLHDVNDQLHLVPAFPASEERNGLLPLSDELHLHNALWADDGLRERFISANPAGLSSADLAVVANWRYRRAGSFYIVRALKKNTGFLSEDAPPRAYGVLGLSTPIEELARGRVLPGRTKHGEEVNCESGDDEVVYPVFIPSPAPSKDIQMILPKISMRLVRYLLHHRELALHSCVSPYKSSAFILGRRVRISTTILVLLCKKVSQFRYSKRLIVSGS